MESLNEPSLDRGEEDPGLPSKMGDVRMLREIGLLQASTIMAGIIIGSGIFVSPTSISYHCGSVGLSLLLWAATGILVTLTALCFAELGCLFPSSGGIYLYTRKVLGDLPGFLVVYIYTLVMAPAFFAILAMTTSNYILYSLYKDCAVPEISNKLLSAWIVGKSREASIILHI